MNYRYHLNIETSSIPSQIKVEFKFGEIQVAEVGFRKVEKSFVNSEFRLTGIGHNFTNFS